MSATAPAPTSPLRLDVVTIFPGYLKALDLSLIGKAAADGLLDLRVHDLRSWTTDRHRTVDDTPLGGGAGMVMRPDVWGRALDEVLARHEDGTPTDPAALPPRQVLVVPTPSGEVFTQRTAESLAQADQVVFACGRYEGIDFRVAEHYRRAGVEVRELSIGDYVLNGGEVAALVMTEAVARLRPGVLGNPESVVEESHSAAGLLEYPVYTRPVAWRGQDLAATEPALLSGDHGRTARRRRDQSLERTCARRPDMVAALDPGTLDAADRATLARLGWAVPQGAAHPVPLTLRPATADDAPALAALAARTFPDACPSFLTPGQVASHAATHLTAQAFTTWATDPRCLLTLAELPEGARAGGVSPGEPVGYSLLLLESPGPDGAPPPGLDPRPRCVEAGEGALAAELSKVYVDARLRGSGVAQALLSGALRGAVDLGAGTVWLGTHEGNRRAQKAYRRAGFRKAGTRVYEVGGQRCRDVVMACQP